MVSSKYNLEVMSREELVGQRAIMGYDSTKAHRCGLRWLESLTWEMLSSYFRELNVTPATEKRPLASTPGRHLITNSVVSRTYQRCSPHHIFIGLVWYETDFSDSYFTCNLRLLSLLKKLYHKPLYPLLQKLKDLRCLDPPVSRDNLPRLTAV